MSMTVSFDFFYWPKIVVDKLKIDSLSVNILTSLILDNFCLVFLSFGVFGKSLFKNCSHLVANESQYQCERHDIHQVILAMQIRLQILQYQ